MGKQKPPPIAGVGEMSVTVSCVHVFPRPVFHPKSSQKEEGNKIDQSHKDADDNTGVFEVNKACDNDGPCTAVERGNPKKNRGQRLPPSVAFNDFTHEPHVPNPFLAMSRTRRVLMNIWRMPGYVSAIHDRTNKEKCQ